MTVWEWGLVGLAGLIASYVAIDIYESLRRRR